MANYQLNKTQIAELGILEQIQEKQTLNNLAEIAAYTGWSINKVRQAIKYKGMPATLHGISYFTSKANIDQWIKEQHIKLVERKSYDMGHGHRRFLTRFHKPHSKRPAPFPYINVLNRVKGV